MADLTAEGTGKDCVAAMADFLGGVDVTKFAKAVQPMLNNVTAGFSLPFEKHAQPNVKHARTPTLTRKHPHHHNGRRMFAATLND